MALGKRCDNPDPHKGHDRDVVKIKRCDGKTQCGVVHHEPHDIEVTITEYCPGICTWCGPDTYRGIHSDGDHK